MAGRWKKPINRKPSKADFRNILLSSAILLGGLLLIQICYPDFNLPLGTELSGKSLSGWNKKDAIKELNRAYSNSEVKIFLSDSEESFKTVQPADFGLEVDNTRRVNEIDYPWYAKIVPTSLFWWGAVASSAKPSQKFNDAELQKFVEKYFGTPCYVEPRDASLKVDGSSIDIEKSNIGGSCYQSVVKDSLKKIQFDSLSSGVVRIDLAVEKPSITTADATQLAMEVSPNLVSDLILQLEEIDGSVTLSRDELAAWVSFEVADGQLVPTIDKEKSSEFYKTRVAPLVEQGAGVTTIIASDTNAVRIDGVAGRVINIDETNLRIVEYLKGLRKTVAVAIESTDPSVSYVYNRPQPDQTEDANDEDEDETEPEDED
jgi:hypothetical protein